MVKKEIIKKLVTNQAKIKSFLLNFGLTENQADIYLLGLSLGETSASVLGRSAGLHRSTAQYTCMSLVDERLMTVLKIGNTHMFTSEDPDKLSYLLDRKILKIHKEKESLNQVMGDLKTLADPLRAIPRIKYYQGVEGIIGIFEDALKRGHNIYGLLKINKDGNPELLDYMSGEYAQKKQKTDIKTYGILNDNECTRVYTQELDEAHNRVSLFLPEKIFEFAACMMIYGDIVCFFTFTKSNLMGIKIQDPQVQKTQFSIFKLGWEVARKLEINKKYKDITL